MLAIACANAMGHPPEPSDESLVSSPAEPQGVELTDFLVLPALGSSGRTPLHQDPIEGRIARGDWKTPTEGDEVKAIDGSIVRWRRLAAGAADVPRLAGGYALATVDLPEPRIFMLRAAGHVAVYVNGEPRVGNPYGNVWLELPVALAAGKNEILLQLGGQKPRAQLMPPAASIFFDPRDATLPDLAPGQNGEFWAALPIVNATTESLEKLAVLTDHSGEAPLRTELGGILPLAVRKAGFRLGAVRAGEKGPVQVRLRLVQPIPDGERLLAEITLPVPVRLPGQPYRQTFISQIDGSVQYFAVVPASRPTSIDPKPGILLTLHGASVDALRQARQYSPKPWVHVVAPTNRRPFGFDWEDWGRLDALEVLDLAQKQLDCDPRRTWLSGHSMGGHGVWHLGTNYPDRFAAIGPSAGWLSFWTYGGLPKLDETKPIEKLLAGARLASDSQPALKNLAGRGVYILHGARDTNVPVEQARQVREMLGKFHDHLSYYENPTADHWWGAPCCDWPPMMQFFSYQQIPTAEGVRKIDFVTANPGISSRCHWTTIEAQTRQGQWSRIHWDFDPLRRHFQGETDNVARLSIDVAHLPPGRNISIELDRQSLAPIDWPRDEPIIRLERRDGTWQLTGPFSRGEKGPHRNGGFKDAFRNQVVLVYGTRGTPAENAWSLAKAKLDAETFWYRGNSGLAIMSDDQFAAEASAAPDRNVVVYGNADTNGVWPLLLSTSPVQIRRGLVSVDDRFERGDDLGCLLIRPRPGSDTASVGVVAGTGLAGLRATNRLRYFVSGVAYPDLFLFGASALERGLGEIRALGYFGHDWSAAKGEIVWRDDEK